MKKTLLILISILLLLQAFVFTGCDISDTELPENSSEILSDENEELNTPPSSGDDFFNGDFSDGDFSEPPPEEEVAIHFAHPDQYLAFLNGEADVSLIHSVTRSKYIGVTPEELIEYVRNAPIYAIESSAENYSSGWGLSFHIKKASYYSNYLFYYNYHGGGFDNISFTFDAEMGPLTAEARQIYEKQGIEGLKCPSEYDKKVTITIDGNDYVCYRQHVKECLTDLSVGDIVTVTIETNERHVEDKAVFIYGFTHNGKIIYDVREANEGIWFIKFVILPIFVIAEIIAGIALIVRVVVFIRVICKRSSMIKANKTKRENLN